MEKEFSAEFLQEIADLIDFCGVNNTDSVELRLNVSGKTLKVEITFSVED